MQMRRCAVWVSLLALFAFASPALAAPKGKKHRKDSEPAAADSGETKAAPVEKEKVQDVDDLMSDSTKKKPATAKPAAAEEPDKASADVGEPDAWERPPAEEEKPKKKKFEAPPEEKKGDGRNMDLGVYVGYGLSFNGNFPGGAGNPYGLGGGLQGTYALDSHIFFGLGAEMYLGATGTIYYRYLQIHGLVGYDLWFGKLLLRPSLWLGASLGMTNNPAYLSGIQTSVVWGIGLALNYMLGDNGWYIGADIHFTIVTGSKSTNGMPLLLTLGKRF